MTHTYMYNKCMLYWKCICHSVAAEKKHWSRVVTVYRYGNISRYEHVQLSYHIPQYLTYGTGGKKLIRYRISPAISNVFPLSTAYGQFILLHGVYVADAIVSIYAFCILSALLCNFTAGNYHWWWGFYVPLCRVSALMFWV